MLRKGDVAGCPAGTLKSNPDATTVKNATALLEVVFKDRDHARQGPHRDQPGRAEPQTIRFSVPDRTAQHPRSIKTGPPSNHVCRVR